MKTAGKIPGFLRTLTLVLLPTGIAVSVLFSPQDFALISETIRNVFGRPVLRIICQTASKVDFSGRNNKYISRADLREIEKVIKPGDIIFRRNEDQLTNIVISGFWTHSGIYIGGKDEINDYFKQLKILKGKKPSEYIEQHYPGVFGKLVLRDPQIIEAVCEGVTINPLDRFANADYFSAIRPVIEKEALFKVLLTAFENFGKPYDFLFDSRSDDFFFCSEFVYKSFLQPGIGLQISTFQINGEPFITPNDIALLGSDTNPMFRFVTFYCADRKMKRAFRKEKDEFMIYAAN